MNRRLTLLFNRYIDKTATPAEVEELFLLLSLPENEEQVKALLEEAWDEFQPQHPPFTPQQGREMLMEVMQAGAAASKRHHVITLRKAAVAACIALFILAGAWLLTRPRNTTPVLVQQEQAAPHIPPGGNKAVLTLANGATVTLDSAGRQVIQQGNAAIRQHNGQLQYQPSGAAAAEEYNTLSTPRGGQFSIVLPDGSRVWLNSASSLRYPTAFSGRHRAVELQGQGYFEIAPNPQQPFTVKVNGMEVQVLGTQFDIMAYADEATVNTTLVQGSVLVHAGRLRQPLRPGQQAVMDRNSHAVSVQDADINKALAWKNGLFVFNNTDLTTILREIARWYDVDIEYAVRPAPGRYGGGISRRLELQQVLRLLEANGDHHFRIAGRKVTVLP